MLIITDNETLANILNGAARNEDPFYEPALRRVTRALELLFRKADVETEAYAAQINAAYQWGWDNEWKGGEHERTTGVGSQIGHVFDMYLE